MCVVPLVLRNHDTTVFARHALIGKFGDLVGFGGHCKYDHGLSEDYHSY